MNRIAGALAAALVALAQPAPAQVTPAAAAFRGVWWTDHYERLLRPSDGTALPFTPAGRAAYEHNKSGLKDGTVVDQANYLCLPEGMPRAMTSAYPFQILMTPGQVTFAHEANRAYRIVAFTDKHADPKVWDPSFMGDGIAHWEGATLVMDSTNIKADKIYLDASGLPTSDKLHLIERITTSGKQLEDAITIDDPDMFTQPWTVRRGYKRRDDIQLRTDWVCGEKHRDVSAIMARSVR